MPDSFLLRPEAFEIKAKEKDLRLDQNTAARTIPSWQYVAVGAETGSNNGGYRGSGAARSVDKPAYELRLLGMRADEAVKALERQIDLCVLNGLDHFSVIHGKGTGALKDAVQKYLKAAPAVQDFSFAPAEDGGEGKTYVKL